MPDATLTDSELATVAFEVSQLPSDVLLHLAFILLCPSEARHRLARVLIHRARQAQENMPPRRTNP